MARFPIISTTLIITLLISLAISSPFPPPHTTSLTLAHPTLRPQNTTTHLTARDDDDDDFANDSNGDRFDDDTHYPLTLDPSMVISRGCAPIPAHSYIDSHEKKLYNAVTRFCKNTVVYHRAEARPMTPVTGTIDTNGGASHPEIRDTDVYNASVAEVRGCGTREEVLDLMHPMGNYDGDVQGYDCLSILYGAWKWCSGNKGRGGWVQSGCLNYSIVARY